MTERPILFSAPMVRAILAGRKTVTRRVIKPQPKHTDGHNPWTTLKYYEEGHVAIECGPDYPDDAADERHCPYGAPGDQLWLRETWAVSNHYDSVKPSAVHDGAKVAYAASGGCNGLRLRPSIFMPRWASRITLAVTAVSVERVQDINDAEAEMEGVDRPLDGMAWCSSFARLWDAINGKRAPWESNPWVWVVRFKVTGGEES